MANTKNESIRMTVRSKEGLTKIKQTINQGEFKIEERKKRDPLLILYNVDCTPNGRKPI